MAAIGFDYSAFIAAFPAFAQTPQITLQTTWQTAGLYVNNQVYNGCNTALQTQYLNLMTAHLLAISCLIQGGDTPGIVTAATIDKISVTLEPPPQANQFQWWLNTTPYGQQLLALLQIKSVGGYYVGGSPVTSSFRGRGTWLQ